MTSSWLCESGDTGIFFTSDVFIELIAELREWDRQSMPGAPAWLDPPLGEAMIVSDSENLWSEIRSEFRGNFKDMVYSGSLPDDDEVLTCLTSVGASLARV